MPDDLAEEFRHAMSSQDLTRAERRVVLAALAFTICACIGTLIQSLL